MKKILILMLIFLLFGCDRKHITDIINETYFSSKNINRLNLANIDLYWSEGVDIDTSYYMGAPFEDHSGFIEGIRLFSQNGKEIWVFVFKSKEDAINAMELRINDVASVIKIGDQDEFENRWWYSDNMVYCIFVNQYNTIIEIDFQSNAPFVGIKGLLIDVAKIIIERIDKLS